MLDRTRGLFGTLASEDEEQILLDTNIWVIDQGLPEGELEYKLADEITGELLAVLDLAWPNGLQEGYSQPVALLIDEDQEIERIASQGGFRLYTDVDALKQYIRDEILTIKAVAD